MTTLLQIDESLFRLINIGWQHPFLDLLIPFLRDKYLWFPFYLFLLAFLCLNFEKKGLWIVLGLAVAVGLSDFTSSQLIKKSVQRLRPCKVLEPPSDIHLLVPCGSGYSFPSSHASNHFAMAVFLSLVFNRKWKLSKWLLLFWATSVSLAQIYVGVHYPLDVLAGGALGTGIATIVYFLMRKLLVAQG